MLPEARREVVRIPRPGTVRRPNILVRRGILACGLGIRGEVEYGEVCFWSSDRPKVSTRVKRVEEVLFVCVQLVMLI